MRPATRVVPKALLTVVDRPAIQYAVEEAARAGATEAIVIVDLDAGHLVAQHFSLEGPLPGLEDVHLRPVVQEEPLGLGHAVNEAAHMVGDRPFFCLLSDNIVRPGHDVLDSLAAGSLDGSVSVMCLRLLDDQMLSRYGVVVPVSEVVNGYLDLSGAVEKPGVANAPSRYGLVGRYLFTPEVFSILERLPPGVGGEVQLTDAINQLGVSGRLRGFVAEHDLLDVGTPEGLLQASIALGRHRFGPSVVDES
jgi:UTP--glucose-1-phosphate uridylyltransferase